LICLLGAPPKLWQKVFVYAVKMD